MEKEREQGYLTEQVKRAAEGDRDAMEEVLSEVKDLIFTLSLRMLGTISDAEDASQEILIRVMTHLSTFRGESMFSTWVFRVAVNHLLNYRKSLFAAHPLNFEFYGSDIREGTVSGSADSIQGVDRNLLAEELKLSCTNVMLQCLEPENRCVFILGTMFRVNSRVGGEIMGITAENYRQRLSRSRKVMGAFLGEYCGWSGTGMCSCAKRLEYAVSTRRLKPDELEYSKLRPADWKQLLDCKEAMEHIDDLSLVFDEMPGYRAPDLAREFLSGLLESESFCKVKGGQL